MITSLAAFGLACARSPKRVDHSPSFGESVQSSSARLFWSKKMEGLITDLSMSRQGNAILVSLAPDPDSSETGGPYRVSLLDSSGQSLWTRPMSWPTKSQTISEDGSLVLIASQNQELLAFDASGKQIWSLEESCSPIIMNLSKRILCYHDDDAVPRVAFSVFDWSGQKLLVSKASRDLLTVKVSSDEQYIAIGYTHGQFTLFNREFKPLWKSSVQGEVVDISVSPGKEPFVIILSHSIKNGQSLSIFNSRGKRVASGKPGALIEQVEAPSDDRKIWGYGNSAKGQYICLFSYDAHPRAKVAEIWCHHELRQADYTSVMATENKMAVIGLEDVAPPERHSHIVAFDHDGKMKWDIPVITEEGAYLYGYAFSPSSFITVVGTDDAVLSVFKIEPKANDARFGASGP